MKENIRIATVEAMCENRDFTIIGTTHCALVRLGFYVGLFLDEIIKELKLIQIINFIESKLR